MIVAELVGRALAELGVGHASAWSAAATSTSPTRCVAAGVPFVAARARGRRRDAWPTPTPGPRGAVGVLSVHQGCGLTNALTGITEAAKSRTPLLVLAADTAAAAVRSNFRIDQAAAGRGGRRGGRAGALGRLARSPTPCAASGPPVEQRRTVVLNLPLDVQAAATCPTGRRLPPAARAGRRSGRARPRSRRWPRCRRGRSARCSSPAAAPAAPGAELARAGRPRPARCWPPRPWPTGCSPATPWSLGISGGFATPLAAELIADADLVVGWGCTLNMWTTRHGALIGPAAAVVQVDLDPDAIGANRPRRPRRARRRRGHRRRRAGRRSPGPRPPATAPPELRAGSPRAAAGATCRIDDLDRPRRASTRGCCPTALDELLPAERTVAVDSGNFMGYPAVYLRVPDEHGFCFTQAFQSIGLGLATAIGAALARPDRLAVAALGDGGS